MIAHTGSFVCGWICVLTASVRLASNGAERGMIREADVSYGHMFTITDGQRLLHSRTCFLTLS